MLNTASTAESHELQVESIQQDIHKVVGQLPLESLKTLQQFAMFLQQQESEKPAFVNGKRPLEIKALPVSSLTGLIGALSPGYEGNALEDTEALYDDI